MRHVTPWPYASRLRAVRGTLTHAQMALSLQVVIGRLTRASEVERFEQGAWPRRHEAVEQWIQRIEAMSTAVVIENAEFR